MGDVTPSTASSFKDFPSRSGPTTKPNGTNDLGFVVCSETPTSTGTKATTKDGTAAH